MKIITLDGPSGVGKTAVGLALSHHYQMDFISLGIIYRALAWSLLHQISLERAREELRLVLRKTPTQSTLYLPSIQNRILDEELYNDPELELLCSQISQELSTRQFVRDKVLGIKAERGLIIEGRSAGKFFSHAHCKIYLTASQEERLKRNLQESRRRGVADSEEILAKIRKERDERDTQRKNDPLRFSLGTVMWDSTYSTFEETTQQLVRWIDHHVFDKKLRISVIIPVFNREEHLKYCLQALFKQTLPPNEYEIIVVDDGSQDRSAQIAKQLGAHVIYTPNKGPGAARNRGLEKANGDMIVFLDADIITSPDYLETVRKKHSLTNSLLLLGARRHLSEGVVEPAQGMYRLDSREKLLRRYSFCLSHLNSPWSLAYTCNFSFPKALLKQVRFDEQFIGWGLEDIDFAYQLYQQGAKLAFSREICGYHLHHDRSLSQERYKSWLENLERLLQKHSDPKVQAFALFKSVFDPQIQANYFDVFDQFENKQLPPSNVRLYDLTEVQGDGIEHLQDTLRSTSFPLIILNDRSSELNEIYLPFCDRERVYSFLEKEDWPHVEAEFKERLAAIQKEILYAQA